MRERLPVVVVVAMLLTTAVAAVPVAAAESVSVETEAPTDVTTSTATLQGNVTALQDADNATVWFEYWPAGDEANSSTTPNLSKTGTGPFSIEASGLQSATEYVVVAHAETESGDDSKTGSEVSFTTDAEPAVAVSTGAATDVTDSSARLNGELTTLAAVDNATVWFEYWAMADPANASTTANQTLDSTATFSAAVDGLAENTTYVFVAHAATENLSDAGDTNQFTTFDRDAALGVDTLAASDVQDTSATLNGQLTGMDGAANATVRFEYWVQGDGANTTNTSSQTLDAPGSFSAGVTGLANDTTYVYVAHAAANNTTVTGEQVEFTTAAQSNETTNRTWDGEGPFGQWLSGIIRNLVPPDGQPLGQLVSEIVTANNPGSEHRSDKANPGGNGPPEHANASDDDDEDDRGPPEHANDDKDKSDRGPPEHAGEDDEDEEDEEGDGGDD